MWFFFFNDTATTEIYTLSLHDALPISLTGHVQEEDRRRAREAGFDEYLVKPVDLDALEAVLARSEWVRQPGRRSEEHTSELQSRQYLVCRLLLEKKKKMLIAHLTASNF